MPLLMTVDELERFLAAEFPQVFRPAERSFDRSPMGAPLPGFDRPSARYRCAPAARFPARP